VQVLQAHSPGFKANMFPHPDPVGGADGAGAAKKEGNATGTGAELSNGFSKEKEESVARFSSCSGR